MKKIYYIIITVFILSSLSGCSSSKIPKLNKSDPVTVTIWHHYIGEQKKSFDKLVADFNNSNGKDKGIIVEAFSKSDIDVIAEKLNASLNNIQDSEPLPNAFFAYSDYAYSLAKGGIIADFDSYMSKKDFDKYIEGFIEEGRFLSDGKAYILPIAKSTEVLMINKTELNKFYSENSSYKINDLTTWEGLSKTAQAYYDWTDAKTDTPYDGKAFFGIDNVANFIISSSKQLSVDIITKENDEIRVSFDEDVLQRIWDTYYVNTVKGYFGSFARFRSDDAKTGNIISYLGLTTGGTYFPKSIVLDDGTEESVDFTALKMPVYENAKNVAIQQGAGIALLKSTPQQEYAMVLFLKWLTENTQTTPFVLNASYLPVTKSAIKNVSTFEKPFKNLDISANVKKTLKVAGSQINTDYQMYQIKPFETSSDIKLALQDELIRLTNEARNAFTNDLQNGISYEDAIAKYISEESYNYFTLSMEKAVEQYIQ